MATGLYVPIRGDYSEFQKDIKRLQGIARQSAEELSNIFGNAFSKGDAQRGLSQIGMALKKLQTASRTVNAEFRPVISELETFAKKCRISAMEVQSLTQSMGYAARQRQLESSLRTLQRQAGLTDAALANLARRKNLLSEASGIASKALGVRTDAKIQADIVAAKEAFKEFELVARRTGESTQRQFEAMTAKVRQFSMELMTASQKEAFLQRERYNRLASQVSIRGGTDAGFAQYQSRNAARDAVSAFQELNDRLPRPKEIREIAAATGIAANQIRKMRDEMDHSSNAFKALIGYAQVWLTFGFAHTAIDFVKTAMALENVKVAFQAIYGTADMAQAKLDYVRQVSEQLGLSFLDTAEGAKKLFAAAAGTPVEKEANMVFKAFSDMSAAMKLSGDETKGVFLAISQMISKGKVSAEELRQQLAERMPGAVNLFARSIGKTTQELDKMLQKGEVTLEHFLMFSREVQNTYGPGAVAAGGSLQAELNRLQNAWVDFKASMTDTDTLASGVRSLTAMFKTLSPVIEFVSKHVHTLATVALAGWIGSSLAPGGKLRGVLSSIGDAAARARERVEAFNKGQQTMVIRATGATAAVGKLRAGLSAIGSGALYGGLFAIAGMLLEIAHNAYESSKAFQNARKSMSEYVAEAAKTKDAMEKSNFTPASLRQALSKNTQEINAEWSAESEKLGGNINRHFESLNSQPGSWGMFSGSAQETAARNAYERINDIRKKFNEAIEKDDVNLAREIMKNATTAWVNGLESAVQSVGGELGSQINKAWGKNMEDMSTIIANTDKRLQTFSQNSADAAKRLGVDAAQMAEGFKKLQEAADKTDMGKAMSGLEAMDKLKAILGDTSIAYTENAATIVNYAEQLKNHIKTVDSANQAYEDHKNKIKAIADAGPLTVEQYKDLQKEQEALAGESQYVAKLQQDLTKWIVASANAAGGTKPAYDTMVAVLNAVGGQCKSLSGFIQGLISDIFALTEAGARALAQAQGLSILQGARMQVINTGASQALANNDKEKWKSFMRDQAFTQAEGKGKRFIATREFEGQLDEAWGFLQQNRKMQEAFKAAHKKGGGKKGGGGSKRVDNTAEKYQSSFEGFRKEIAKLRGETDKVTLDKKFADMDKQLVGSRHNIQQLKKDYYEAFNVHALHEFDKTMYQLVGNERALADIDIEEKLKAQQAQFDGMNKAAQELGLATVDYTAKMEAYKKALENNKEEQYLQKLIPIQKDIAYNDKDRAKLLELQNQLIDLQAEKMGNSLPQDVVDRWKELQRLQAATDPLSGLKRGFIKLAMDAKSAADIMEETVVSTADMMGDALGNFFMKGKFGMQDFLNSWISMVSQMIMKAATSQIFSMIGGLFSFGGGIGGAAGAAAGAASASSSIATAASSVSSVVGALAAYGGVFSGLHGYANQIVSRPTLFSYGSQLTRFAKGGVMGEAGPEAIMPLARTASGHLGVRTDGGSGASSMQITLVVNDQTEGGVNASVQNGELDGRQIAVIVKQVENAMVARSLNGKSMYTKYLDKTRGLSNAKQLY